jgi:hypothetical protein
LCAPVVHKGALTGALYLENNLVTGAFTPDRARGAQYPAVADRRLDRERDALRAAGAPGPHDRRIERRAEARDRRPPARREELGRYRDHLEELVVERTRELEEAQGRLVDLSRKAGMAEVAAGVLHNVGNVMNSVNVGASMARESVASLQIDAVLKVSELLLERAGGGDLGEFLTRDERGRRVPEYLDKLGPALAERRGRILGNIDYMLEHLEHMKRIVSAQQTYAKSGGMTESCCAGGAGRGGARDQRRGLREARIEVRREIESAAARAHRPPSCLQILVNLVSNAKHALMDREGDEPRVLRIAVRADGGRDLVHRDRGQRRRHRARRPDEDLHHGFTTRREGHGFGLHNSANAAQAMDGRLTAHSRGRGTARASCSRSRSSRRRGATAAPCLIRCSPPRPRSPRRVDDAGLDAERNARILIVDDNRAIPRGFPQGAARRCGDANSTPCTRRSSGRVAPPRAQLRARLRVPGRRGAADGAQGADATGRPYALAFVDVRMPPGHGRRRDDAAHAREDAEIGVIVCSAYSDHRWEDMAAAFGDTDRVLILKKPFDTIEVRQLAHALQRRWELARLATLRLDQLAAMVDARTRELRAANAKLEMEAARREQMLRELGESHEQIRMLAYHDGLTGLPNRRRFNELLDRSLSRARRNGTELAVLSSTSITSSASTIRSGITPPTASFASSRSSSGRSCERATW